MVKAKEKLILITASAIFLGFVWRGMVASSSNDGRHNYSSSDYVSGQGVQGPKKNSYDNEQSNNRSCNKQLEAILINNQKDFVKFVDGEVYTGVKMGGGGSWLGFGFVKIGALALGKDVTEEELAFMKPLFSSSFKNFKEQAIKDLFTHKDTLNSDPLLNGIEGFITELQKVCSYLPKAHQGSISFKDLKHILHCYNCARAGNDPQLTRPKDIVNQVKKLEPELYTHLAMLNLIATYLQENQLLDKFIVR